MNINEYQNNSDENLNNWLITILPERNCSHVAGINRVKLGVSKDFVLLDIPISIMTTITPLSTSEKECAGYLLVFMCPIAADVATTIAIAADVATIAIAADVAATIAIVADNAATIAIVADVAITIAVAIAVAAIGECKGQVLI